MLDPVIDALQSELLKRFPADRSYSLQQVSSSELPTPVKDLLTNRLEANVSSELTSLDIDHLKWVDTDHADVRSSLEHFTESGRQHARIPATLWTDALRDAIADVVAGFGDPVRAIVEHVYGDQVTLPIETILARVRSFVGLQSLRDSAYDSASRRNAAELSIERFESLVTKVNDLRCEGYAASDWLDDLVPLSDLFGEAGLGTALPTTFIVDFLKARGLVPEATALFEYGENNISIDEARPVITGLPQELEAVPAFAVGEEPAVADPVKKVREDGAVPLWRRYQKNLNAPYESPTTSSANRPEVATATEPQREPVTVSRQPEPVRTPRNESTDGTRQPLWQRFRSTTRKERSPARDVADLERVVLGEKGVKERDAFIAHLFGGSEDEYRTIVCDLHDAQDWSEASRVIAEDVFKRHQVNIYSEPAVAFTNAVEARFRSRSVRA